MRAQGKRSFMLTLRRLLWLGIALAALLVGYGFIAYPNIAPHSGIEFGALIYLALLLGVYVVFSFRLVPPADSALERVSIGLGLLIGVMWVVEIVVGNLNGTLFTLNSTVTLTLYFGSILSVLVLSIFAGVRGAQIGNRIRDGILLGLESGMLSALVAFSAGVGMTFLFIQALQQDPQTLREFARSGASDIVTFVIQDFIFAFTNHLLIGIILGLGLGAVGAIIGRALSGKSSTMVSRA